MEVSVDGVSDGEGPLHSLFLLVENYSADNKVMGRVHCGGRRHVLELTRKGSTHA